MDDKIKTILAGIEGLIDRLPDEMSFYSSGQRRAYALVKELIYQQFPELKESEDERIRKDLAHGLIWQRDNFESIGPRDNNLILPGFCFTVGEHLAYLEKQKVNTDGDFARGYDCGYECCLNSHGAEWFEKQKEHFRDDTKMIPNKKIDACGFPLRDEVESACSYLERTLAPDMRKVWYEACAEIKNKQESAEWSEEDEVRRESCMLYLANARDSIEFSHYILDNARES